MAKVNVKGDKRAILARLGARRVYVFTKRG